MLCFHQLFCHHFLYENYAVNFTESLRYMVKVHRPTNSVSGAALPRVWTNNTTKLLLT